MLEYCGDHVRYSFSDTRVHGCDYSNRFWERGCGDPCPIIMAHSACFAARQVLRSRRVPPGLECMIWVRDHGGNVVEVVGTDGQ